MRNRIVAILFFLLFSSGAFAEYWDEEWDRPVHCCEGRIGCQVLQMVMMGSFDPFDLSSNLNIRVFSAAFSKLQNITQDDVSHFMEEYEVDESVLRTNYYIALGNCLWADILAGEAEDEEEEAARQVLLIFLDPSADTTSGMQIDMIRNISDETVYSEIAQCTGLPVSFVQHLIESEHWQTPPALYE